MKELLSYNWKFKHFPEITSGVCPTDFYSVSFDDSAWQTVRIPHDWAASGEFKIENDCSYREITADGITNPIEHSGRTGGLPTVGLGVYRVSVDIPEANKGESVLLEFDGVMWECNVYVNGKHAFFNHFGYKSFEVDVSNYIEFGTSNLITVAASVYNDCSRWYSGAGIYRNAYISIKKPTHIKFNGIWLRQLEVADGKASYELSVEHTGKDDIKFRADVLSPSGEKLLQISSNENSGTLYQCFSIENVQLWDVDSPSLYTAEIHLLNESGEELDFESVKFGARNIKFTADKGFFLNDRHLKLKGVCLHHDLGSIGAAVNKAAMKRQLLLMQEIGVNAIRTSHNPPAPEFLELCDEMGFLVIDEFFDEWNTPKVSNGYAKYFKDHAEQDVIDIIKRDRNHPCIILWSIGNEILEQREEDGWKAAKLLSETCHKTDPTRLTTAGFDYPVGAFKSRIVEYVDVCGFNYKPHLYKEFHEKYPNMIFMGSETASCVSTRGVYHLPANIAIPCNKHDDLTLSAYELEAPQWASYAEREFAAQDDFEYVCGEFVWTGFDYLGEPTPYYSEWPSRSSYFGILDLSGQPKNRFYGYKANWTNSPVLHIFPHWNWEGREGKIVPVHVYTNYYEVELFVNGKSYGKEKLGDKSGGDLGEIERYRMMWNGTIYAPGEVKAVAYDEKGNIVAENVVRTATEPHHIMLTADKSKIDADGNDLVYVTATVVDKSGTACPHFNDRLYFSVTNGELLATDNGDPRETESFARPDKRCLSGSCVACIRSVFGEKGKIKISVKGDNLNDAEFIIEAQ